MFQRTELLIGKENLAKLASSRIAVFGLGGVGGYVVEALARAGVGELILIDSDKIDISNLNRQILALNSTINQFKVDVAFSRIADINPNCVVKPHRLFVDSSTINDIDFTNLTFCVDAIDTLVAKVDIVKKAQQFNVPIISCMGTANRTTADFVIKDVFSTSNCPLASKFRTLLRKQSIKSLPVLVSLSPAEVKCVNPLSSISYAPAIAGLLIAQYIIKHIIDNN
ncbi:MAG: ThiF family adenylyltransferase [Clostridia bacterium]